MSNLNGNNLRERDVIKYLGVTLSYRKPHAHVADRFSNCRKVFYGLQVAGLCNLLLMYGKQLSDLCLHMD